MVFTRFSLPFIVTGLLVAYPTMGWGQQQLAAMQHETLKERVTAHAQVVQAPRVTLVLEDVPLEDAVKALASEAGAQLVFTPHAIPRKLVSVKVSNVPIVDALRQTLQGTGLSATMLASGIISVGKATVQQASRQGILVGKLIHGKTKQPVMGATVVVDGTARTVTSSADGTFRLPVEIGERAIHIRAVGFVRASRRVTITEGETTTIEIALDPSASVLDEVIVTGTIVATERKAVPNPITVITAADIEQRGITRIEDLFRGAVPGVVALESGSERYSPSTPGSMVQSHVYSRGSSSLQTTTTWNVPDASGLKTYIDGVELLDATYLGSIDPASIERIEIVTGPQAATVYGSGAMGGVMQIFTKKGSGYNTPELTLSAKYGMLQSNMSSSLTPSHRDQLSLSGGSGAEFSYAGTLSYNYTGQWQPNLFNRTYGASLGATHTRGPVTATASMSQTSGTNGTTNSGMSPRGVALAQQGEWTPSYITYSAPSNRRGTSSSQTLSFRADYRVTPSWQHNVTIGKSRNNFGIDPTAPINRTPSDTLFNVYTTIGERTSAGYNTTLVTRLGRLFSTNLTLGATGSWGEQTSVSGRLAAKNAASFLTTPSAPQVRKSLDDKSWGAFGSWQAGFLDKVYFTFGLRAERNPTYGAEHKIDWTPSNGLTYTVERGDLTVKLLGSYGRATRAPAPNMKDGWYTYDDRLELDWIEKQLKNPYLRPETSRGPQGGVELYYGNLGSLTVTHFSQKVTDLIQNVFVDTLLVPFKATPDTLIVYIQQYVNVANVRQRGWEGTGSLNLGSLALRGTYSWNDSEIVNAFGCPNGALCYYPGYKFINVPTHTGNVTATYAIGATSVTLSANYIGRYPIYSSDIPMWELASNSNARIRTYALRLKGVTSFATRDSYVKSDLTASHRINPATSLTLNVTNLGNSFAMDRDWMYPTMGRNTLVGVSVRFPGSR